ncbi:hypothetical protein FRX31_019995, partial [Thalictrum thalictroides]
MNDRAGIRPNKSYNSIVVESGGHENVSFLQKDFNNGNLYRGSQPNTDISSNFPIQFQ